MELKGRRAAVTGAAGFIGSHLADRLLQLGAEVIAIDNLDPYYPGKERNTQHNLKNPKYHFLKPDILDLENLSAALKGVDVVFHLAAQPGVRYSMENPIKTSVVNTTGTLNVLIVAKRRGVKKVIFASSSSVYGNAKLPMKECDATSPISPYGVSKLAAEQYCRIYHETYDMKIVLLRYFTVYGPRQRPDMAIHKFTKIMLNDQPPRIYGDGKQTRDFTYIKDVVNGTILAAETDGVDGEIFNLGSGTRVTVNQLVGKMLRIMGKEEIMPVHVERQVGDMKHTLADISKTEKRLGYRPKTTIEEGLEKYVNWFTKTIASGKKQ